MSNIKVTVEWENPVVFAGEDVRCIITFKNCSNPIGRSRSLSPYVNGQSDSGRDRWKQDLGKQPLPKRAQSLRKAEDKTVRPQIRGHRPAMSLGGPSLSRDSSRGPPVAGSSNTHRHGRSLSIVSMSPNTSNNETKLPPVGPPAKRLHGRAASLQIVPLRNAITPVIGPPVLSSPRRVTDTTVRRGYSTNAVTGLGISNSGQIGIMGRPRTDSRTIPASPLENLQNHPSSRSSPNNTIRPNPSLPFSPPQGRQDNYNTKFGSDNKILSPVSQNATPRSSLELYSQSNLSTETLASEYVVPQKHVATSKSASRRGTYLAPLVGQSSKLETLMMGYVQLSGSFTLDGSLISMSPFESVKMKGVIGGQGGGGVVGVEKSKRESGLLGSFGWGGIGQSLGGLIGGQEMSSIKEMKSIANTKAIPIISTPHSILFVNLSLQPGESRSYSYSHRLPDDLPPTYKGRAIKIEYQLIIGTQRPQQTSQPQSIRHADFAFRVLSGVTPRGELPVYDLKSPHIVLRDLAKSQAVEKDGSTKERLKDVMTGKPKSDSDANFVAYVDKLLNDKNNADGALLSPSETRNGAEFEIIDQASTIDYISLAILRGNAATSTKGSTNRFDIHRGGQRVATVVLVKSAYRLGERLTAGLDFQDAILPCYAVHTFLETLEEVDESIALRSAASITRATRRIHASCFENAICAQRLSLSFMIPTTAAPEFKTSSIQLKWSLRIEFTTDTSQGSHNEEGLLEEINEDERGRTLSAAQELPCETFDVLIPIRVYGGYGETREPVVMSSTV